MKVGLVPVNIGVPRVEPMLALAEKAEQLGYESLWTFEHVIVPIDYKSRYPYSADGKMAVTPETNFVDPLVALTAIAARTRKIRLGTGVNILSQANPLYLAKQAASLDFVSNGRFMLGLGVGWLREEFRALGVDPHMRGRMTDEYLEICRRLWRDEVASFAGKHYRLPAVRTGPKPAQRPWPPIWVGGNSDAALTRAARLGDGWHAIDLAPEELAPRVAALRSAVVAAGRDPASVQVSLRKGVLVEPTLAEDAKPLYGTVDKIRRDRDAYARAGVDYLVVNLRQAKTIAALEEALDASAQALLA